MADSSIEWTNKALTDRLAEIERLIEVSRGWVGWGTARQQVTEIHAPWLVAEVARLRAQIDAMQAAFVTIRTNYGKVCPEFETSTHPSCESSVGSWMVADRALAQLDAATDTERSR